MRLTAVFDSVNSADLAAAAIRKNISSFHDISINEARNNKTYTVNKEMYAFSSYNPSINQYTFSLPVSTRGIYSNTFEDMNETDMRTDTTMEVICHKDDRKKISGIIVGMGGREIRFTD